MKRMIFVGILVSVFAFSGLAFAGGAPIGCLSGPVIYVDSLWRTNPDGDCERLVAIPAKRHNPNHWTLEGDLCDSGTINWITSDHDKGDQGGFEPTFLGTFGCSCFSIISIMEEHVYYPGALDGHIKFGCTKSLIEEFIDWCSSNPDLCIFEVPG